MTLGRKIASVNCATGIAVRVLERTPDSVCVKEHMPYNYLFLNDLLSMRAWGWVAPDLAIL